MATIVAGEKIAAVLPSLHDDVIVEEVDCKILVPKKDPKYYGIKEWEHVVGRLMYVTDNSDPAVRFGLDNVLHILMTKQGKFIGATVHHTKISPEEVTANQELRTSSPFGDPKRFGRLTVPQVLETLDRMTEKSRQGRIAYRKRRDRAKG